MTNPSTGNSPVPNWFKSSYNTNDGPECVEVALASETVHVRDSKHTWGPDSPSAPGNEPPACRTPPITTDTLSR
ncbi:DUF397 domain-containing protein [Streptomyces sp. NPDC087218]|uniref:DUF397 domain-containing protein n=1 Tax=Streptomyces sp. NPDC087218 TaxID=3365769 RepID=UPI00381BB163